MELALQKIYLDSNVLIAFFDGREHSSPAAKELLGLIGSGKYAGLSSCLLYVELLKSSQPSQHHNDFMESLPNYKLISLGSDIAKTAQDIRAKNLVIRTPVAIHLATAILSDCDVFISQDKKLLEVAKKHLKASTVEDFSKAQ